jgi:hypothetical protein
MKIGLSPKVPIYAFQSRRQEASEAVQNGFLRRPQTNISFYATDRIFEAWEENWGKTGLLKRKCDRKKAFI